MNNGRATAREDMIPDWILFWVDISDNCLHVWRALTLLSLVDNAPMSMTADDWLSIIQDSPGAQRRV